MLLASGLALLGARRLARFGRRNMLLLGEMPHDGVEMRRSASGLLLAVRYLIVTLLLAAVAPALRAEIYECVDANGNQRYASIKSEANGCKLVNVLRPDPVIYECVDANGNQRFTNIKSESKGCKLVNVFPPETVRSPQPQAKAAATPAPVAPTWLTAARDDPEPSARLQAIESWARGSRDTLDPVTHALVDPDESVRARAQVLWEEALKRR